MLSEGHGNHNHIRMHTHIHTHARGNREEPRGCVGNFRWPPEKGQKAVLRKCRRFLCVCVLTAFRRRCRIGFAFEPRRDCFFFLGWFAAFSPSFFPLPARRVWLACLRTGRCCRLLTLRFLLHAAAILGGSSKT